MPTPIIPLSQKFGLAPAARRSVQRNIELPAPMKPHQIAAICGGGTRNLDLEGLRDRIEAKIESERSMASHPGWYPAHMLALRHALLSTDADGFEAAWNAWRGA